MIEPKGTNNNLDAEWLKRMLIDEIKIDHVLDAFIVTSAEDRNSFWAIRDAIDRILLTIGNEVNFYPGIPLSEAGTCVEEIDQGL